MVNKSLFSEFLLLITAAIWGFAFVAQRIGMNFIKPFTYNGIRFFLGAITLVPVYLILNKKNKEFISPKDFYRILLTGFVLFIAANLQQIGIVYTTAGNAGFITGLYVLFVPILSILFGKKTPIIFFIAAIMSIFGLYFLSMEGSFKINKGDIFVAIGAIFWAIHIMIISFYSKKINNLILAIGQFLVCSIFSTIVAFIFEIKDNSVFKNIVLAKYPILYGGILSISVAYTLQIVGQKKAHPAVASIIMSLESLFAFIGGVLVLKESTNFYRVFGAILMLLSMILAQFNKESDVEIKQSEKKI